MVTIYKPVFDENGEPLPFCDGQVTHVLSFDEKPSIRAIATTSEDLLPDENHGFIRRDYKYKRLGTLSLLTGIELQIGEAFPPVNRAHNRRDYIRFLMMQDNKNTKGDKIRIVLDTLKVHTSEETRKYLAGITGRFEFVCTPKHDSWLNMVEGFFSKNDKAYARGIRMKSEEELTERIYLYFSEESVVQS